VVKTLDQLSGMPHMKAAFSGWTKSITLKVITQTVVDGFIEDASRDFTFQGTIQPLQTNKIILKPEGQRSWEWLQIHCITSSLDLKTNDRIEYGGRIFKIMAQNDYSLNNFIEYHAVADYQDGAQ
jgi:hypothetical protein